MAVCAGYVTHTNHACVRKLSGKAILSASRLPAFLSSRFYKRSQFHSSLGASIQCGGSILLPDERAGSSPHTSGSRPCGAAASKQSGGTKNKFLIINGLCMASPIRVTVWSNFCQIAYFGWLRFFPAGRVSPGLLPWSPAKGRLSRWDIGETIPVALFSKNGGEADDPCRACHSIDGMSRACRSASSLGSRLRECGSGLK